MKTLSVIIDALLVLLIVGAAAVLWCRNPCKYSLPDYRSHAA